MAKHGFLLPPSISGQCVVSVPSCSALNPSFDLSLCRAKLESDGFQVRFTWATMSLQNLDIFILIFVYFRLFIRLFDFFTMLDSSQRHGGSTEGSSGCSLSQEIHGFQLSSLPFCTGTGMMAQQPFIFSLQSSAVSALSTLFVYFSRLFLYFFFSFCFASD